jgi:protein-disulfide isomerase
MYDTQAQWGEQQESRAPLFRQFAQELGLDLAAYDKAVADPATQKRVEADRNDGVALGVQGTPTFFLNGTMIQPQSVQDFEAKIDAALAK